MPWSFNPLLIGEAAPPVPESSSSWRSGSDMFQSPSHRGGGAARIPRQAGESRPIGFNPLLIGEAAPPSSRHGLPCLLFPLFQSPSHRGGGAAYASVARRSRQDSSFNPLLIGDAAPPVSTKQNASKIYSFVSIPFSSGRRRRRLPIHSRTVSGSLFQSPSHRGGGAALEVVHSLTVE